MVQEFKKYDDAVEFADNEFKTNRRDLWIYEVRLKDSYNRPKYDVTDEKNIVFPEDKEAQEIKRYRA